MWPWFRGLIFIGLLVWNIALTIYLVKIYVYTSWLNSVVVITVDLNE